MACIWGDDSVSKICLRLGSEACACSTCVGVVVDVRSTSIDGHASFSEARGAGGDCGIESSLGSNEVACLILGFWLFFMVVPSEVADNGSDGRRG